jgi:hypothetical protein
MTSSGRTVELRVLCEGQTEQRFVNQVLAPHLQKGFGVYATPQSMNPRSSGGVVPFDRLRRAIQTEVGRSRVHQHVTTMIDLYKIGNYPGADRRANESGVDRAARIEASMAAGLPNPRFHPYVQVHEFEALVFVDLDELERQFPDGEAQGAAAKLRRAIGNLAPEQIDDGPHTAPSKRIIGVIEDYYARKSVAGPAITEGIGLSRLRASCPHFNTWVSLLEGLTRSSS